ncbi:AAA family ATPase [Coprococcus sp. MSK.21.13]|nr:AAA family ATPase [Coprococcus sp. MSK.21.13]
MYKYYLGSFGNRSYIRPQYEILSDGSLREVGDDRWTEFPNGGTVSLSNSYEGDTDDIRNRLLRFRIDFRSNLHPNFDQYNNNSNKYQIGMNDIDDFDRDEIIEIIDIDYPINDFLNDNIKREIRIKHKPNRLILLKYAQDCYGPFEFMISDIEAYGDESFYTLKIFVNSGIINKYRMFDLERIIFDGTYSIRRNDKIQFIFNLDSLDKIEPTEQIDYIDNEELANFFKDLLDKSEGIENLAELREQFLQIADSFSEKGQMSDFRLKKICELLQTSVELSDYKVRLMEEYFRNNPKSVADKEEYLRTHSELLDEIARKDSQYDSRIETIKNELHEVEVKRDDIAQKIIDGQIKLDEQKQELEKLGEQALAKKQQDLEELLAGKKQELRETEDAIIKAKIDRDQMMSDRDTWKRACEDAQDDYKKATNNLNAMIIEWAANNRNTEIVKLLVSQLELPDDIEVKEGEVLEIRNLCNELSAEQVVEILMKKMSEAGRNVSKDEAYNYLISICQNYITVFAGEPGTGKTSLCKLLAKSLGLYDNRFAEILVERGWTSSKDLIGYYNPLTKEIEETQPAFSNCMKQLTKENLENCVKAPYYVLLDEANLSPIEYYWSHFNFYADDPNKQKIIYSNGTEYSFGSELKFLATINYDQTTADLSPRFLDRAWVISMGATYADSFASSFYDDTMVSNSEVVISIDTLNNLFDWKNVKDKKMNQITKTLLDRIIDKMKDGKHTISPRSIRAITHYYLVAEKYMSSKEVALDFAIAQKILPCINGNGKQYGEFLKDLMIICKENQLNKSANIISKIIERSQHEFYGFFSL